MKTKEFEEAIKHYDNSIRLNPIEPTTYCNRALALIKTKSNFFETQFHLGKFNLFFKIKFQNTRELWKIVKALLTLKEITQRHITEELFVILI